jgi:hypothetical protein
MRTIIAVSCAVIGASILSFPALAQQKTVKACEAEWRANKDANQAQGITLKAYVTQCRAGASAAQPSQPATTTAAAPATAGQKTAKACRDEWRANKADNQAKGITEKAYVTQCRAGGTVAQPAPAPMAPPPAQTRTTTAPTTPPSGPAATTGSRPASTTPTGANQYQTEAQAKFRCGPGTVVWANTDSKIYHFSGNKAYGKTKTGAYMCEQDATSQGLRAAKNEKHP